MKADHGAEKSAEKHDDAEPEDERSVVPGVTNALNHRSSVSAIVGLAPLASIRSKILLAALRASGRKKPYLDADAFRAAIAADRKAAVPIPKVDCEVTACSIAGMNVYTFGTGDKHAYFFHGGCYVFEITPSHYRFCAAIAKLGYRVTIPMYPLAPETTAVTTQAALAKVIADAGPADAWLGDSAGAGLALALAQTHDVPNLILLSPWLDIELANPEIPELDARDPWLSRPGLREAGRLYAGALSADDPRVSPIRGSLESVKRVSTFIGTRDVLCADARAFHRKAGQKSQLFEYPNMVHDFMLLRRVLPEAHQAFSDIANALKEP
jgi:acetyl esterase/lipase